MAGSLTDPDNTCIYRQLLPIQELGSNPYLHTITPTIFQRGTAMPDHLRLSFVCMTLSHRMNQAHDDSQNRSLARGFYHYRGLVLRSLTEELKLERRLRDDIAVAGIMVLLLLDVSLLHPIQKYQSTELRIDFMQVQQGPQVHQGNSLNWRFHLEAVYRLVILRGGVRNLVGTEGMEPLLLALTL